VAKLLANPPQGRKWIEVVENRLETLEFRVVVDELLKRGTESVRFRCLIPDLLTYPPADMSG
jgi:hypothetical protein